LHAFITAQLLGRHLSFSPTNKIIGETRPLMDLRLSTESDPFASGGWRPRPRLHFTSMTITSFIVCDRGFITIREL